MIQVDIEQWEALLFEHADYKHRAKAAEALLRRALPLLMYASYVPGKTDAAGELEFDIQAHLKDEPEVGE